MYETAVQFLELTDLPRDEAAVLLRDAVSDGRITVLDYMRQRSLRVPTVLCR
ncbi:hypothetical protein ACPXCP_33960 [Streptomyces sp. DT20]|uniref:hypothetical protein n=1 Tax=Streptomyces sp. DT20 TaxID=3416519 RepID=UPI003CE8A8C9